MRFSQLRVPVTVAVNGRRWWTWHVTFGVKVKPGPRALGESLQVVLEMQNPSERWWRVRARLFVLAMKVLHVLARLVRRRLDVEVTAG